MILLVSNVPEFLDELKPHLPYLATNDQISCALWDTSNSYCEQNIPTHAAYYYEPDLCIIVREQESIPYCLIQDIIRSTNPEKFPIVAGIGWQNLVPKLSFLQHCFQNIETDDELYNLFTYLTNYFFETCIIPLLIPIQTHYSSLDTPPIIGTLKTVIESHKNTIQVMNNLVFKPTKIPKTVSSFVRSLTRQEISLLKEIVTLFAKRMKFTFQMSEQVQKKAMAASFFSFDTVCMLFEQYPALIPQTKVQAKQIFEDIMNKLNTLHEALV